MVTTRHMRSALVPRCMSLLRVARACYSHSLLVARRVLAALHGTWLARPGWTARHCMSFGRRSTAMPSGRRCRPTSSSTASKPAARPSQSTASSVEAMRTMRRAACNMAARKTCSMRIGHATRRRRRPFGRLRHNRSRPRCSGLASLAMRCKSHFPLRPSERAAIRFSRWGLCAGPHCGVDALGHRDACDAIVREVRRLQAAAWSRPGR